jgi:hypothetical protein
MLLCHVYESAQSDFVARSLLAVVELSVALCLVILCIEGADFVKPLPSYFSKDGTHKGKSQVLVVSMSDVNSCIKDALAQESEILLIGHCGIILFHSGSILD